MTRNTVLPLPLSLSLTICLVLLICKRTWGQPENEVLKYPTSSIAPAYEISKTNSAFFDIFLSAYVEAVDIIVDLQTPSWNYLERYKTYDEWTKDGMCDPYPSTNVPKFARSHAKTPVSSTTTKINTGLELSGNYKPDRESDIDGYFTELAKGCSKDIDNDTAAYKYTIECLDLIKSIVYLPRCTTMYDSRVECNGEDVPSELSTPSELIANHFGSSQESSNKETLHVVIVGAGPVGLMLGNALSMLRHQEGDSSIPPIKILFLETRAEAPGIKKPYTRNWQAHLSLLQFRNRIDPRFLKIAAAMTEDKDDPESGLSDFALPTNVIETLLMLSNRDLGAAKFLFGVNPLDVVEDLKKVPNLVLVDATGHRLDPLHRGYVCDDNVDGADNKGGEHGDENCIEEEDEETIIFNHRTPPSPTISWNTFQTNDFYEHIRWFWQDVTMQHDLIEMSGQHLHIGRAGDLMYPIDETTMSPKSMMWLSIHGAMPLTPEEEDEEIEGQTDAHFASEGRFCKWCKSWSETGNEPFVSTLEEESAEDICDKICYSSYYADSASLFREDINENILNGCFRDTFVNQTDSWFPIMSYDFNPSAELAEVVEKVLVANGFGNHHTGMAAKKFYPALIREIYHGVDDDDDDDDDEYDESEYQDEEDEPMELSDSDWDMIDAIKKYTYQSAATEWPTVSLTTKLPFIYTNGIRKKKRCGRNSSNNIGDHLDHAPMIRFGDSLTVGDGLRKYKTRRN